MATRTLYCGQVSNETIGQTVTLKGWVQKRRDLGGVIFIDLRDREGFVQVVFNPAVSKEAWAIADKCRSEYVIEVTGEVIARAPEAVNPEVADTYLLRNSRPRDSERREGHGLERKAHSVEVQPLCGSEDRHRFDRGGRKDD